MGFLFLSRYKRWNASGGGGGLFFLGFFFDLFFLAEEMNDPHTGFVEDQQRSRHHQLGKDVGTGSNSGRDDEDGNDGNLADAPHEVVP